MITRQDLKQLQSLTQVPALSILLPTHRTFPENKQDPIQVKNLVDEAKARLGEEFSVRELQPLIDRLDALVSEIDYPHTPGLIHCMSRKRASISWATRR